LKTLKLRSNTDETFLINPKLRHLYLNTLLIYSRS